FAKFSFTIVNSGFKILSASKNLIFRTPLMLFIQVYHLFDTTKLIFSIIDEFKSQMQILV
ncbi:MAG: hypothetical protein COX07_04610, partial [Bacteroidetes bacterium CG23_combo_of_CG06-09_8_20_14_all_32_9]